ncbi:hypothetical protein [Nocardia sp. NPDC058666]|uniref:hypothetical protein n=1 Tax=Nocardia sp. NPDC058666 TaxID=3346587 RepID=UPI00364C9655
MAVVAVFGGLITVGCADTVSGQATVNEADRAAHVTSVSAAAATSSSKARAAQGAVCGPFLTSALQVKLKIDALKRRLDEKDDRAASRTAAQDAATALDDSGDKVDTALAANKVSTSLNTALTEYASAAHAFGTELNKLALGSGDSAVVTTAQTRYFTAKDAALTACGSS